MLLNWDQTSKMSPKLLVVLAGLALAACATAPKPIGGAPGLQVTGDLPPPTAADTAPAGGIAEVGRLDTLKIDVFGVPELSNRSARVDSSGHITFPLVGELAVAGKNTSEIATLIESGLRGRYIRDPQVTVQVEQVAERTVTVFGQVRTPGVYPVQGGSTLMKAVASAHGFADYANSRDVVVFRTVNGQKMATLYNLQAISRGIYEDPRIYGNDTIVVGESSARHLFDDFTKAATLVSTPLILLLQ
jgi:polysaccharide export outer membrane protein